MDPTIIVSAASAEMLPEYGKVPMFVNVSSRLRLEQLNQGLLGLRLVEEPVNPPYIKSYEDPSDAPNTWSSKWNLSEWGFFAAMQNRRIVGGSVVAYRTEGIHMLEGRNDIAVLWDIRVHPQMQHTGIGSQLFGKAKAFAEERGCKFLKIETQNINVPACRFYRKQGCYLGGILQHAYKEYPNEVELLWYLPLERQ